MFPTINKKETGVNLRRIMDMRGVKPKDIQEYLGFGCVQSVYRWLDGVSMPTVDNLYAISKMLQVPMDSIVCGNAGRTKSQMDACLTDQARRVYTYYKKMRELNGMASYSKMKAYASQSEYDGVCSGIYDEQAFWDKKQDWFAIIDNAKQTFSGMTETYSQSVECGKLLSYFEKWNTKVSSRDLFSEAVQKFRDDNQLTAQELKEEKDWREMTDEEWDKMIEGVDEYIDAFKERLRQLKEIQDEAAQKAALEADSDMRATAASAAALSAAANGLSGTSETDAESQIEEGIPTEDGAKHEKNWTKNLKTDDQTVLRTAKEAQEMENKALSRFEEVQLTGTTTVGFHKQIQVQSVLL